MKIKEYKKIIYSVVVPFILGFLALPGIASAQSPFPVSISSPTVSGEGIAGSINNFYLVALGLGGIAAVGVIVVGALMYTTSGAIDKKNFGKELISSAIWGLVLLLGAFIVLNTINPELVQLRNPPETEYEFGSGRLIEGASCIQYPEVDPCQGGEEPEFDEESGAPSCCIPSGGDQCPTSVTSNCKAEDFVNLYPYCEGIAENHKTLESGTVWQHAYYLALEEGKEEEDIDEEDLENMGPENAECIPYAIQELNEGIDKFTLKELERNFSREKGGGCNYYGKLRLIMCDY